ncbi:Guanine nucleotide-binding protein G(I)/G(S)/G(O) subunit gamma-13 [Collichthys lucidus]|uniref:Guanine nucleotide-binding protein G(I)/G(S)/G(O) subunit gamma-13 n=1 Tax=Collichthys lucidus TaxID=240159 RepID=A0A4U5VVM7_COLLU|nr:Guanine nucleotide-binding protein G(I)/G(S)/G(O) subunit gamma-13 [Collichthys lucidus]
MDEMDLPQMKKEVESLKYQLAFKREKSSKTVTDLVKWIEDWRPRGSLPQPGADEEQPVGGERKVHPSLEETGHQSNYPD